MKPSNFDVLDLVAVTVGNIRNDSIGDFDIALDVRLDGDNILIGNKPVSIDNIKAHAHSAKGFLKFIKTKM